MNRSIIFTVPLGFVLAGCVTVTTQTPSVSSHDTKHHRLAAHPQAAAAPAAVVRAPVEPAAVPAYRPELEPNPELAPASKWTVEPGFVGYKGKHFRWYVDRKHHRAGLKFKR